MSIYDKASLVLIPSGTKTSKVYSQKPVSGNGDFTFSRSTAATRVNADGNIEKETQNLLLQSNSFNATWNSVNVTMTSGQSGYDGSSDAWELDSTAGSLRQTISQSGVFTFSCYAKAGTAPRIRFRFNAGTDANCYVDLSNGVGTHTGIDLNVTDAGNGWYRIALSHNDSALSDIRIYATDSNDFPTTGNLYIQDAQLEQGLVARDYIETTTAAVEGGITDNVPRLDYTDSSCPALLLEPQRTNLLPNSEYIGSSDWDKNGFGTGVAPVLTFGEESPEGLNNAYEITFNTGAGTSSGNQSNISEGIGGQAAGDYTLSFWAKVSSGTDKIIARGAGGYLYTTCNLTTEWQRFEITENLATAGTLYADIGLRRGLANEPLNSSVTCQIYGIQMEAGSYATSYIPTYGTSVTRSNDYMNLLATNFYSTTSYTYFLDIDLPYDVASSSALWKDNDNLSSNGGFQLRKTSPTGSYVGITTHNGTSFTGFFTNVLTGRLKLAIIYNNGQVLVYYNGIQSGSPIAVTGWNQSTNHFKFEDGSNGTYETNQFLYMPTALTDQEAIDLTTI